MHPAAAHRPIHQGRPSFIHGLRLFRVKDWVFVAALTLEEAIDYHRRTYDDPGEQDEDAYDPSETHETSLLFKVATGEQGEPDTTVITAHEAISIRLQEGKQAPFEVCYDAHYC